MKNRYIAERALKSRGQKWTIKAGRNSLVVQWLRLPAFTTDGQDSVPEKLKKGKNTNRMWGQLTIYMEKGKIGRLEPYLTSYINMF